MIARILTFLRGYFALLVVVGAYVASAIAIVSYRAQEAPPDTITLRIGHWQLEAGVRDGLNEAARDYQQLHPRVRIVQDAIPETVYGQWVTSQLIGGTAPDMMEFGWGFGLPYHIWVQYLNRYFHPLTRYVNQPNPYNTATDLEGVPLRQTFKDGMQGVYSDELQEYVGIPLSLNGVRVFYNQDLLKALTGLEEAPREYRAFLAACETIGERKNEKGDRYIPIASSRYHYPMWESMMCDPLTYPAVRRVDFNRDGRVGVDELYVGVKTGRVDFQYKPFQARFQMMREISRYFQTGYTGLTRDEAVFLFAQQRAVFITTGTWDARSLQEQARGKFDVGVLDFPLPGRDDPEYGAVIAGPVYERPMGGFPFAITRTCQHPELALDFLMFLASQKQNERLNQIIGWIPNTRGARVDPLLQAFEPHLEGVYGTLNVNLGGETFIRWNQLYALFLVHQMSYDELAAQFEPFYKERGLKDFMEVQRDWRRGLHKNEQFLAAMRARALAAQGDEAESRWIKYRVLTATRQIWPEIEHHRQMRLIEKGPGLGAVGPYEYSEEVLRKIRRRIVGAR